MVNRVIIDESVEVRFYKQMYGVDVFKFKAPSYTTGPENINQKELLGLFFKYRYSLLSCSLLSIG